MGEVLNPVTPIAAQYETVAASATAQVMGGSGALGDHLEGILIIPGVAACGLVSVLDGSTTIFTFPGGGTTALPTLAPIPVPFGVCSQSGPWKITTGANVTVIAFGAFT